MRSVRDILCCYSLLIASLVLTSCGAGGAGGGGSYGGSAVAPSIKTQPANQTVTVGQTATFMVIASGTAPLTYQWQKNGAAISGATSASYTTPVTTAADNGSRFTVVVSNTAGSVTGSAATLTVNQTVSNDFDLKASASNLALGVGGSQTVTISVTATSGSAFKVDLSATASSGSTAELSGTLVNVGDAAVLTVGIGPNLFAPDTASVMITGKIDGGNTTHSLTIPVKVTIGGGTLTVVPRTQGDLAIPSGALPYITKLIADLTAPGFLYDTCGSASGTRTVEVVFDPPNNEFVSNANGGLPTIHVAALPSPDANGVDKLFDQIFTHEFIHALRNDQLALQEISAHDVIFAPDEEGFAQGCARFMMRRFAESGKRTEDPNFGYESSTLIDTFARIDPVAVMGIRGQARYSYAMYNLGEASYRLLIGPQGVTSYAAYEEKYFSALNAKGGGLLTKDERRTFLNSIADIDGVPSGDWFSANASIFLESPTPMPGTKFIAFTTPTPYYPNASVVLAFTVDVDGNGAFRRTPVTNGPVTIEVLDAGGVEVLPLFTADLANTTPIPEPFLLNLQNILLPGVYTLVVKATANGQQFTQKLAVAVVPFSLRGSLDASKIGPSYVYAVSVDAQGDAANGALAVTEGTVVYKTTGLAIIQAGSNGEVTVNGKKFTSPQSGSRTVFVLGQ